MTAFVAKEGTTSSFSYLYKGVLFRQVSAFVAKEGTTSSFSYLYIGVLFRQVSQPSWPRKAPLRHLVMSI